MKVPKDKPVESTPTTPAPAAKPSVKRIQGLAKQSILTPPKVKGVSHTYSTMKEIESDLRRLVGLQPGLKPQRRQ